MCCNRSESSIHPGHGAKDILYFNLPSDFVDQTMKPKNNPSIYLVMIMMLFAALCMVMLDSQCILKHNFHWDINEEECI